jgi:endogenous inhibitor of DNA gyrase (YacG/DUF329 family)
VCGETFAVHAGSTGRWCSMTCAGIGRRTSEMKPRPCEQCGELFKPTTMTSRYCSRRCLADSQRRQPQTCPTCGQTFDSRHRSPYCSKLCAGVARRVNPDGRPCDRCGKNIPWPYAGFRRFCSMQCRKTPVGTRQITDAGYVNVMTESGWIAEHRLVMAQTLGRPVGPRERVHHRNGDRTDNHPENLELWRLKGKDPSGVRAADYHCPGCRCAELPMG